MKGIKIGAIALLLLAGYSQVASASFTGVHKSSFGGKDKVIIPGQTPDAVVAIDAPGVAAPRSITLDRCGWGKFTESASSPVINISSTGQTILYSSATTGAAPTCTAPPAGSPANSSYISSSTASLGSVVRAANVIWVKGGGGGAISGSLTLDVTTKKTINAKANACGFASVTISATRPMTNFSIAGASYVLANLPTTINGGMICRKSATGGTAFVPVAGF